MTSQGKKVRAGVEKSEGRIEKECGQEFTKIKLEEKRRAARIVESSSLCR